jgi:hypothetical protein
MTNTTPSAAVRPAALRPMSALRATLRARLDELSERRSSALTIGSYPATRSAAVVVLPVADRQVA